MKHVFVLMYVFLLSPHCFGAYYYGQCLDYHCNSIAKEFCKFDDDFFYSYNIPLKELQQQIKDNEISTVISLDSDEAPEKQKMELDDGKEACEMEKIEVWDEGKVLHPEKLDVQNFKVPLISNGFNDQKTLLNLTSIYKTAARPILVYSTTGIRKKSLATAIWVLEVMKKPRIEALSYLKKQCLQEDYFLIMSWQGEEWLKSNYDLEDFNRRFKIYINKISQIECCCFCCEVFVCCIGLCDTRGRCYCTRQHWINRLDKSIFGHEEFDKE